MSTLFLFGLAGVGKSFLAEHIAKKYAYYLYEGDDDITPDMRNAIAEKRHFTDEMRDEYFRIVADRILELQKKHQNIVVAQGLYKNKHRHYLMSRIPDLQFVWVQASQEKILERLQQRDGIAVSPEYAKKIQANFEVPDMPVMEFLNEGPIVDVIEDVLSFNK